MDVFETSSYCIISVYWYGCFAKTKNPEVGQATTKD